MRLLKSLLTLTGLIFSLCVYAQPNIELETFATGLSNPVDIANAGDDRMFVVERTGKIRIVEADGTVHADYFLDIHTQIESGYQEQGLLGLAFHPDYAVNGYFYVYYTDTDGNTVVSRFSVSAGDPDYADAGSELVLLTENQPFLNHNGGCIKFGGDGYLYIGLGDGGSAGDPGNRAQNPELFLGKMLRIDVDGGTPYAIPDDNPFATATDTLPEIWAIGLRNPWRFSFDALTKNLWIGDVGQNLYEEVDVELAGDGGRNYGWRCYEGLHEFNTAGCDADTAEYIFPVLEYNHNATTGGFSITGGFVYRGSMYPGMYGYYITADYVSGNWWWIYADGGAPYASLRMDDIQTSISCFGEDMNGELYCANLSSGIIYHIKDACGDFMAAAEVTDYTCGVTDGAVDITITAGTAPYTYEWSSGETTEDISGITEGGTFTLTVTDASGCTRMITATVEELPGFIAVLNEDGGVLTATPGTSWQWYLNGEIIDGATSQSYTPTESGDYSCLVTDANGCSSMTPAFNVFVEITTAQWNIDFSIHPNPASDVIYLQITDAPCATNWYIADMTGNVVWRSETIGKGNQSIAISLTSLANGIYLLRSDVGSVGSRVMKVSGEW